MHRNLSILASLAVIVSGSGAIGCSSSSSGGGGGGGSGSGSGSGGAVSFKTDVMPIFQRSCTLVTCHGSENDNNPSPPQEGLLLGDNTPGSTTGLPVVAATAAMVYQGLVNVASVEDPKVLLIKPSDTADSYLIQKLNGNLSAYLTDCAAAPMSCTQTQANCSSTAPCGIEMPSGASAWPTTDMADLATVTDWVSQGALNN
jgi:hypothetical protein